MNSSFRPYVIYHITSTLTQKLQKYKEILFSLCLRVTDEPVYANIVRKQSRWKDPRNTYVFVFFTANNLVQYDEVISISSDESLMSDLEPDSDVEPDRDSWMDPFITDQSNNIESQWIAGINDNEQLDIIDQYIANHGICDF